MASTPPQICPVSPLTRLVVASVGLVLLAGAVTVFFFDPSQYQFYPLCQFHRLTGLNCPGCGMTRAIHALLHGDALAALRANALLVGVVFLLALRGGWIAAKRLASGRAEAFFPVKWLWPLLGIALVFGVVRNLPPFAFLSP
jgi:hypothetical protein